MALNRSHAIIPDAPGNVSLPTQSNWKPSSALKCSLYFVYVLISIFGISGNTAVCYILGVKKKGRRRFDILLISLAFADLLALASGSVTMIGDLVGDLDRWYFGPFLCKLLPSVAPVTLFVSSWSLVIIAFDRFQVIRSRRRVQLPAKVIALQLVAVWTAAVVVTLPYIIASRYERNKCLPIPLWRPGHWVVYIGFWTIVGWGVPLLMIGFIYCLILKSLKRGLSEGCHLTVLQKRLKRNREILLMFITIVCAFFILTTPYAAFYFSATYLMLMSPQSIDLRVAQQVNYALFTLMMINSSINPIIYAKLHKEVNMFAVRCCNLLTEQLLSCCCRTATSKIVVYELAVAGETVRNQSSIV